MASKVGEILPLLVPFKQGELSVRTKWPGSCIDAVLKTQLSNLFLLVLHRYAWSQNSKAVRSAGRTTPSIYALSYFIFADYSQNSQMAQDALAFHEPNKQHCWDALLKQFWFYVSNLTPFFLVIIPFITARLIPLPWVFTAFTSLERSQVTARATSRDINRTSLR